MGLFGIIRVVASVAQLFRALPCQGRGRELESHHSHHLESLRGRGIFVLFAFFGVLCYNSRTCTLIMGEGT